MPRKGSLMLVDSAPGRASAGVKGVVKPVKRGRPAGAKQQPVRVPESAERVLVTVSEAARRLSIGRATCYKLVMAGTIRSILIGRLRRVPVDAVEEFAASQLSA